MFIIVMVVALIGLLGSLAYLVYFALASRSDTLHLPASSRHTKQARRVTGMYTRGTYEFLDRDLLGSDFVSDLDEPILDDGDQLVGR